MSNTETILKLTKARIGIKTNVRDEYLQKIVESVIEEMNESHGLLLDSDNSFHLMFVVDYASWRYLNRDQPEGMPRHLQFRLHNMIISNLGDKNA